MSVTTASLSRSFGAITAVDDLDLQLPDGGVVGLVGPNGSGKSTLIRMLLGLITPTSGTAQVLGQPIDRPRDYASRVGALIESPAFVPSLSARANLRSLALLRGLAPTRVDEVLDVVGLTGRGDEPVRRFSLGMKQRLGIAAALLPNPDLLVLDEPTNGLDPAGIVEVRALLQALGRSGRTVVVSSHLLSEIETICTYVVVVRFGVLVFSGPVEELMQRAQTHLELAPEHLDDLDRLHDSLAADGWDVSRAGPGLHVLAGAGAAAEVNRRAAAQGITLSALTTATQSLETVFLEMTGSDDRGLAAARGARAGDGGAR